VSSAAGRNGGFRLFVGAPEDELIPVLSVAAAVGVGAEPEPREKGPGTTEGVAKVYGLSLPADMIPTGSGGSPIGRLTSRFQIRRFRCLRGQPSSAVQHYYLFQQVVHSSRIA